VAPKHVSDRLFRDVRAEVGEGARDPNVTPSAVLLGHPDDQRIDLRVDARPSRVRAMLRSVELAGDQAAVPAENRLGFGDTGDLGASLRPRRLADFSERSPPDIGERHIPR
jgi:hypothetical protein